MEAANEVKFDPPITGVGDVRIRVDNVTYTAVRQLIDTQGIAAWLRYSYRAINEKLFDCGEARIPMYGEYKSPYIVAPFKPGDESLLLILIHFNRIEATAKRLKISAEQFILESLAAWAKIPEGMALD